MQVLADMGSFDAINAKLRSFESNPEQFGALFSVAPIEISVCLPHLFSLVAPWSIVHRGIRFLFGLATGTSVSLWICFTGSVLYSPTSPQIRPYTLTYLEVLLHNPHIPYITPPLTFVCPHLLSCAPIAPCIPAFTFSYIYIYICIEREREKETERERYTHIFLYNIMKHNIT